MRPLRVAVPVVALVVALGLTGCSRLAHHDTGVTVPAPATTSSAAPAASAGTSGSSSASLQQDSSDLDAVDGALTQAGSDLDAADQASQTSDQG